MGRYAIVSTKSELEKALQSEFDQIIVTDSDLASNIKTVKTASYVALVAAIGAIGVASTNFWNPIGWGAGAVGLASSGTIIFAVIALGLGATLIYAIYYNYNIKAGGKITLPDGTIVEAELVLDKK